MVTGFAPGVPRPQADQQYADTLGIWKFCPQEPMHRRSVRGVSQPAGSDAGGDNGRLSRFKPIQLTAR